MLLENNHHHHHLQERLNGDLKFKHGSLADLEANFLQGRICAVEDYLEKHLPSFSELGAAWKPLGWWRFFQFEPLRCEGELLEELLHSPERQHTHLEEMLALRLAHLDTRLERVACIHHYDETYWQLEIQHHVITKILSDWWHWLKLAEK
jgi:hypothetical protein